MYCQAISIQYVLKIGVIQRAFKAAAVQGSSTEHTALKLAINYWNTIKMYSNYHKQVEPHDEHHCLLQSFVPLTRSLVWTVHFLQGQ